MSKVKGLGTTLSYLPTYNSGNPVITVGALTSIGEISPDSDEIDVTTLDSAGGYREFLQGFKDSGELALSGYHVAEDVGQAKMRELYASGALGYFWATFSDSTVVAFTTYVKSYTAGAAEVDGAIGFGATLRITGLIQVIQPAQASTQTIDDDDTATLDATATALTGTPTYQWYTSVTATNTGGSVISGATSATYTTPALSGPDTKYYYCEITVANYRKVTSNPFTVIVTA